MSGKMKAKDLRYDNSLPPFLQRLHDQKAGRADADRHEHQIARPKRAKETSEDDGPTMVDESGETVSKEEYENLVRPKSSGGNHDKAEACSVGGTVTGELTGKAGEEAMVSGALPAEAGQRREMSSSNSLGAKKRKSAKIIDAGEGEEEKVANSNLSERERMVSKPKKRKAKSIKLTFDDGDED